MPLASDVAELRLALLKPWPVFFKRALTLYRERITDHDPANLMRMITDHGSRHDPSCPGSRITDHAMILHAPDPGSRTMDHAMNQPQDHGVHE